MNKTLTTFSGHFDNLNYQTTFADNDDALVLLLHNTRPWRTKQLRRFFWLSSHIYLDSFTVKDVFQYSVVKKGASKPSAKCCSTTVILNRGTAEPLMQKESLGVLQKFTFTVTLCKFGLLPHNYFISGLECRQTFWFWKGALEPKMLKTTVLPSRFASQW